MAVTAADLAVFLGSKHADEGDLVKALDVARALLDEKLATAWRPVPVPVRDRLELEVGSEIVRRGDSPSGDSQFAQFEGSGGPIRAPRDPLTAVWPIIRGYVSPF